MGAQADVIRACALSLQTHRATNLVGEMGTGKTTIGTAAATLAGFERVLVLCPPHLVRKWQREVRATVPSANAVIVRTITDLERFRHSGGWPLFVILSREQAKLSYRWKPALATRHVVAGSAAARDERGEVVALSCCPACFSPVVDDEGLPLEEADLGRKKHSCEHCHGPLWQADCRGPRRYPLADYIARRMPGYFDLLLIDEQHEYKARGSAQGLAAGTLAEACKAVLTLTGTLMGGYSSTLFYLLWRFSPAVREEFGHADESKWVSRYGIVERISRKSGDDDAYEDGRSSRRRGYRTRVVEKPGVSPAVLFHLIGNTAFLRLADVASGLPEYTEEVRLVGLSTSDSPDEPSQAAYYQRLASQLEAAVHEALAKGSKRLLGAYLQSLLAYPDACTKGEQVIDPGSSAVIAAVPPLPDTDRYPKERALLDLIEAEKRQGRRVLVYITHTASRDIASRLESVLMEAGHRVANLKADTVPPERREDWVAHRVKAGLDVLLVHPRLVQTGLDLVDFPTIVWQEVEYSVYTMRQASRRSWRIGQRRPVRVVYLAYRGTLQAQALTLVAKKLKASLAVEGELGDDGLAAFGDDAEDLLMTLARSLTERVESSEESLEGLFAGLRQSERELEARVGEGADREHETSVQSSNSALPARGLVVPSAVEVEQSLVGQVLSTHAAAGGQQLRLL
ncbi:MAG: ATP-dependent helicase [Chloroflexi bacterium]|nr:ATP-dependent helicase [Chloroflexota bacterium]PWB45708.1 MAG: DEAD/DEAH box helicase [Dehalococcoidia bacterium]